MSLYFVMKITKIPLISEFVHISDFVFLSFKVNSKNYITWVIFSSANKVTEQNVNKYIIEHSWENCFHSMTASCHCGVLKLSQKLTNIEFFTQFSLGKFSTISVPNFWQKVNTFNALQWPIHGIFMNQLG